METLRARLHEKGERAADKAVVVQRTGGGVAVTTDNETQIGQKSPAITTCLTTPPNNYARESRVGRCLEITSKLAEEAFTCRVNVGVRNGVANDGVKNTSSSHVTRSTQASGA